MEKTLSWLGGQKRQSVTKGAVGIHQYSSSLKTATETQFPYSPTAEFTQIKNKNKQYLLDRETNFQVEKHVAFLRGISCNTKALVKGHLQRTRHVSGLR